MKLVREKYLNNDLICVSETILKRGYNYYYGGVPYLLIDIQNENDLTFIKEYISNEEIDIYKFYDELDEKKIFYHDIEDVGNISLNRIRELKERYNYSINFIEKKITPIANLGNDMDIIDYIEYWNGVERVQKEIDFITDLDLIESNIDGFEKSKTSQVDLYKGKDGNLYINHNSYYVGDLGVIEKIDKEELKEKYNYIYKENIAIEVVELCLVEEGEGEEGKGIRTIIYKTNKKTLFDAFKDFEENFDSDNIISSEDNFVGECLDRIKALSVKEIEF